MRLGHIVEGFTRRHRGGKHGLARLALALELLECAVDGLQVRRPQQRRV
jgi:hypothetical protein